MPIFDRLFAYIANGKTPFLRKIEAGLREALPGARQAAELLYKAKYALQAGEYALAAASYGEACKLQPQNIEAHIGYGYSLLNIGQLNRAENVLKTAAVLDSKSADAHYMLGAAYLAQNKTNDALRVWDICYRQKPHIQSFYSDYIKQLYSQGDIRKAITVAQDGAILFPASGELHTYLGTLYALAGEYAAAVQIYRSVIDIESTNPTLLSNYSTALQQTGDLELALSMAKKSIELAPDEPAFYSNYLLAIQYSPNFDKAEKFAAYAEYRERFELPQMHLWGSYTNHLSRHRRLKIAYVSGDFRNHSLVHFIEPILINHDKSAFEVTCYYVFPISDDATVRLKSLVDNWVDCHELSNDALALRIRADQIDVLIDLSGHTGYNRLPVFARKPAPVQMTWLGYQATTGLKAMDYRITDESLDPTGASEQYHTERLLRLPSSGTFSPHPNSPPVAPSPVTLGNPFTFGCLNNPSKISDEAIKLWARILVEAENSRILFGNANAELSERFIKAFAENGVAEHRLIFTPKVSLLEYLALHGQIDLALDTFPYNGGTTTFHSLWMGVPILALEGDTALSKVGVSIMSGLELPQFCCSTTDSYVARAIRFAENFNELVGIRDVLRPKMDVLSTALAKDITANLESAFRECWQEYCNSVSFASNS